IRQWKSLRHNWRNLLGLDQSGQLFEDFCIGMRPQSGAADAVLGTLGLVRLIRYRNDDAAFFYDAVGTTERIRTDTIENNIDILQDVFEFCRRVIDRLIDSELLEQILMRGGRSCDDFRAARLRDLNRKTADAARTAMN